MLPATGNRHRPRDSFQSSVRKSLRLLRKSESNDSYGFLRSGDLPVSTAEPRRASILGNNRSSSSSSDGARSTFIQRTMALFRRPQPRQAPKRQLSPPPPPPLHLPRRRSGLTRLVLPSTDDVSFSSSSFFRRVEEISVLNTAASRSEVSAPLSLRPPPRPPRRRPPPPVDEDSCLTTTTPPPPPPPPATGVPKHVNTDLDSALELQASSNPNPRDSPPLAQQQQRRLYASPSIKSRRASLPAWSASRSAIPGPDPLAELLAVSDELKAMHSNLDSDDILYMADVPPLPSLPPTLHAFLDAAPPGASLHILEMEIHRESETFLGVPIPCIVVTSEREEPMETPSAVLLSRPSELAMLAPPPTTYRGRTDADQSLALVESEDQELGSPPCEEDAPTPSREYSSTSTDLNWSWEALSLASSPSASDVSTKPVRPMTPKPAPLLRRHQRSLLRRVLGGGTSSTEKDKSSRVPSHKQKRKRISKEVIGPPRPLSPTT